MYNWPFEFVSSIFARGSEREMTHPPISTFSYYLISDQPTFFFFFLILEKN